MLRSGRAGELSLAGGRAAPALLAPVQTSTTPWTASIEHREKWCGRFAPIMRQRHGRVTISILALTEVPVSSRSRGSGGLGRQVPWPDFLCRGRSLLHIPFDPSVAQPDRS